MPDGLSGLMSSFSSALPAIQAGTGITGTVGNILGAITRNQVLGQQMNLTKKYENLTPAQITAGIQGLEQPLSTGLTQGVGNIVQGQMAERGLSQAPGIFGSTLSQALAPYQLQEQQLAEDAYFKQLGLPIQSRPSPFGPFPQSTNTSPIWQSLMQRYQPQQPGISAPVSVTDQGPDVGGGIYGQPDTSGGGGGGDLSSFWNSIMSNPGMLGGVS